MIAIGFDPSFIDTIVRLENENGLLIDQFPPPGYHHKNSIIRRIAGGNGVNIAATMKKIGFDPVLVVPCNEEFTSLLLKRDLSLIVKINSSINETVAITLATGEIQCNDARGKLGKSLWNHEIDRIWKKSEINVFLNWGLNISSLEWVSVQWLSSCGIKYEDMDFPNIIEQALTVNNPANHLIIEPGNFSKHPSRNGLMRLLEHISKSKSDKWMILLANEEEKEQYSDIISMTKIIHTSNMITIFHETSRIEIEVSPLKKQAKVFVGAGDAFLAGIILGIKLEIPKINEIAKYGINIAQKHILQEL